MIEAYANESFHSGTDCCHVWIARDGRRFSGRRIPVRLAARQLGILRHGLVLWDSWCSPGIDWRSLGGPLVNPTAQSAMRWLRTTDPSGSIDVRLLWLAARRTEC